MTVGLCFLTLNEIDGCKHDIPLFDFTKFEQVYCVDGGSNDGTVAYMKQQGIAVYAQTKKGLNQACKDAVDFCKCDAVVFFHPKGAVPISDAYKFREYFEKGFDLVVASRMLKESRNEEDYKIVRPRKWFGEILALLAYVLYRREGNMIWDSLHGFRGVNVKAFNSLNISDMSPSIDIELVCKSYKKRLKRIEFPTKEQERIAGSTHFKALPAGSKLIKYMFYELLGKV